MKYFFKGFLFVLTLLFIACNEENAGNTTPDLPAKPIVILYENDVHCAHIGVPTSRFCAVTLKTTWAVE